MSCEFCRKFDFTSVAVAGDKIIRAERNQNFVECATVHTDNVKLFQFCPICGSSLVYEKLSLNKVEPHSQAPAVVSVDIMGNKIDYAIFNDESTLPEEVYYTISQLKVDTGCGFQMCKDAYNYSMKYNGGYDMMVAYCKAKVCAVKTDVPFHTRIERFMEDIK